jgi:hypothetical protein
MLANNNLTPGKYSKEYTQYAKHGETWSLFRFAEQVGGFILSIYFLLEVVNLKMYKKTKANISRCKKGHLK